MSAQSSRAFRREAKTGAVLGTPRVHRRIGESAPDVEAVPLADGTRLQPEVKSRKRLPVLVTGALEQARGYARGTAIPMAVLFAFGERDGIACLPLSAFARLVGLDVTRLPKERRTKRKPAQLALGGKGGW